MKITGDTHIGLVRQSNQDSFAYGELSQKCAWAVVCDGMGGVNGGNIASQTTAKAMAESFENGFRSDMNVNSVKNLMQSAVYNANRLVYAKAMQDEELHGMGTTVVAAVIVEDTVHIAHIGDSRAYVVSANAVRQVTKDHSVVQLMIDSGQITPEQAKEHPKKHIITRAIGVEETVEAEYDEFKIQPDEMLLLCSDGLTNYVEDKDIQQHMLHGSFENIAGKLIALANENGGGDNVTVVAVSFNS